METADPIAISAPKTFFVAPDLALITQEFLEMAFYHGFESYVVMEDQHLDIADKVVALAKRFPEHIFFFFIDKGGTLEYWTILVASLQKALGDQFRIGVLYKNASGTDFNAKVQKLFLMSIGISCGCIPMTFSVPKNQSLLLGVLQANQAEGRRKRVRILCSSKYTFNVTYAGMSFHGELYDLSVSHFSCHFADTDPKLEKEDVIKQIQLRLAGFLCMVDAVVALKRDEAGKILYVFVFRDSHNRDRLESAMRLKINKLICDNYTARMEQEYGALFQKAMDQSRGKFKRTPHIL